jgi:hypothetical protein
LTSRKEKAMANEEQLRILKEGVDGWNRWRKNLILNEENFKKEHPNYFIYPHTRIDLSGADLKKADLVDANLEEANLVDANLEGAHLGRARLIRADLCRSNMRKANLIFTNLISANLENADLTEASLAFTNLANCRLKGADLKGVYLVSTNLGGIDLSETKGLDEIEYRGKSTIDNETFQLSGGKISEKFLRVCGLNEWEIEVAKLYQLGLYPDDLDPILAHIRDLRIGQVVQKNLLFISYSHKDSDFVDALEKELDRKGIKFWRDIYDAPAGPIKKILDLAIEKNPTVLLVLSIESVKSSWVVNEIKMAQELENKLGRNVLCPLALDDSWMTYEWPKELREKIEKFNILDYSNWREGIMLEKLSRRLVDGLNLFYKPDRLRN